MLSYFCFAVLRVFVISTWFNTAKIQTVGTLAASVLSAASRKEKKFLGRGKNTFIHLYTRENK